MGISDEDRLRDFENISDEFPALVLGENYEITSSSTCVYNCLSWAIGFDWAWSSPEPKVAGYYWLDGIPKEWSLSAIRQMFEKVGYSETTEDRAHEPGWDKVAFFSDADGVPNHFARQLPSGSWTSKLGSLNDIEHSNLECLEGASEYGPVILIMKRKRKHEAGDPIMTASSL